MLLIPNGTQTFFVVFVAMNGVCVVTLDSTIEVPMGLKRVKSK
jgi:hypothetical protein